MSYPKGTNITFNIGFQLEAVWENDRWVITDQYGGRHNYTDDPEELDAAVMALVSEGCELGPRIDSASYLTTYKCDIPIKLFDLEK